MVFRWPGHRNLLIVTGLVVWGSEFGEQWYDLFGKWFGFECEETEFFRSFVKTQQNNTYWKHTGGFSG